MDFDKILRAETDESGNIPASRIAALVSTLSREVGQNFVERSRYNERLAEIQTLKDEAAKHEEAAAAGEQLKAKYEALKAEYRDYKAEQTRKAEHETKAGKFREVLRSAGVPDKYHDSICEVSAAIIDGIQIDGDGNTVDADKLASGVKEHWGDFIPVVTVSGTPNTSPTLSNNTAGRKYTSVDQIMAIRNTAERQQAIAENFDLFSNYQN